VFSTCPTNNGVWRSRRSRANGVNGGHDVIVVILGTISTAPNAMMSRKMGARRMGVGVGRDVLKMAGMSVVVSGSVRIDPYEFGQMRIVPPQNKMADV
jgi:hypothetical protein